MEGPRVSCITLDPSDGRGDAIGDNVGSCFILLGVIKEEEGKERMFISKGSKCFFEQKKGPSEKGHSVCLYVYNYM